MQPKKTIVVKEDNEEHEFDKDAHSKMLKLVSSVQGSTKWVKIIGFPSIIVCKLWAIVLEIATKQFEALLERHLLSQMILKVATFCFVLSIVNKFFVFKCSCLFKHNKGRSFLIFILSLGWTVKAHELVKELPTSDVHKKLRKQLQRAEKKTRPADVPQHPTEKEKAS